MDPERWQRTKHLYQSALEKEEGERAAFLQQACAGDEELRKEVQALLGYQEQADQFIESSALEVAAKDLADNPVGSLVGQSIDHYKVTSLIGAGGMGEVYRARDSRLNRTVAIKVLLPHTAGNPDQKQRLRREAKAVAALNHPHICVLYDIGRYGENTDYLVMEYLEGETLAQRLTKGTFPLEEVLKYSIQIGDALDKAHQRGVVHRDLKPGNVMLTPEGTKLLDFGLAKVGAPIRSASLGPQAESGSPNSPNAALPLTMRGTIVGTLQYMAPEQLEGHEADARSDIFAFGAVLYEMVTRQKAFQGKSPVSVMAAIMDHIPPPVSSFRETVSPLMDHLIRKCLEKNPDERWQSAADVLIQLHFIAEAGSTLRQPRTERKIKARELVAWSMLTILVFAAIAIAFRRPAATGSETNSTSVIFEIPPIQSSNPGHLALSPDGAKLVSVIENVEGEKAIVLSLRHMETGSTGIIPHTEGAQNPFWSPDGRYIGFFAGGLLKKVGLFGLPPETICPASPVWGGTWNGSDVILFGSDKGILKVSAGGGSPELVTTLDKSRVEIAHSRPFFLPDGNHFLFLAQSTRTEGSAIFVGSLLSTRPQLLLSSKFKAAFAQPNHILFLLESTLKAQEFDPIRLQLKGDPWDVAEGVMNNDTNGQAGFSVSGNGHLAYRPGGATGNHQLLLRYRTGRTAKQLGMPGPYQNPVFSPQGLFVAVNQGGNISIVNVASQAAQPFTENPALEDNPVWSQDDRIAFSSTRDGDVPNLYVKRTDFSGPEERIQVSDHPQKPQSWSVNGDLLYEDGDPKTKSDLWSVSMAGKGKPGVFLRTPDNESQAQFSPDGRLVAYVSDESGKGQIYIKTFPPTENRWTVTTAGGQQPRWGRNGELFFLSMGIEEFMVVDVSVKSSNLIQIGEPKPLFYYDVASLGQRNSYDVNGDVFLLNGIPRQSGDLPPGIVILLNWLKRR